MLIASASQPTAVSYGFVAAYAPGKIVTTVGSDMLRITRGQQAGFVFHVINRRKWLHYYIL